MYPELRDAIDAYRQYPPQTIFLIPVKLSEATIPDFVIDSTTNLGNLQYVELFPDSHRAAGLGSLIKALQRAPHHP